MSNYVWNQVGCHRMLTCNTCNFHYPLGLDIDLKDIVINCNQCKECLVNKKDCYGCGKTSGLALICDRCKTRYCDECWEICYSSFDRMEDVPEDELPVTQSTDDELHVYGCDPCLNQIVVY